MSQLESLTRFHTQVDNFLEAMQKLFPDRKEIKVVESQMELAKMVNPTIVVDSFIKFVLPYKAKIMKEDEDFFLNEDLGVENDYLSHAMHMKDIWKEKLRPENRSTIWKYFKVLILLSEKFQTEKAELSIR